MPPRNSSKASSKKPARPKKTAAPEPEPETPPAELIPAGVADSVIDEVVRELNELSRAATLDLTTKIGEVIVARFYGGAVDAWRTRGDKDASFRKLAARAESGELHVSASGLYRSVAIYELCQRFDVSVRKHLGVTHLRTVLGLPEVQQQRLLTAANDKGWTTERLETEAAKVRKASGEKRGRPVLPRFQKTIAKLGRILEARDEFFGDLEQIDDLEPEEARELLDAVTGMKEQCEELEAKLAGRAEAAE